MRYEAPDSAMRDSFHSGTCADAYRFLGVHSLYMNGADYYCFAVWAPNAVKVCLTGEFCFWDRERHIMQKQFDGIWEIHLPAALFDVKADPERFAFEGAAEKIRNYKYAILGADGVWHMKSDPYAFSFELRPNTASRIMDAPEYEWGDQKYMTKRAKQTPYQKPVNIYEMHLGTWRRHADGSYLTYRELAEVLPKYLTDMRYTHVELMPVMEHPFDGSWGYQVTGYFAPTARYGAPEDFKFLVDALHRAGIAVLLDWVPAHFPRDEAGLRRFDGTALYEHPDPRRGDMPQWGTHLFDFGRGEVCSFLLSNACYWLKEYHADGLRCDAVSSMLYLDFCREKGDFLPNKDGGNRNYEAEAFLKRLNETVYARFPGVMMIAEESSAYPGVTHPTDQGGLGFGFKWNMGWMNDMLSYVKLDPVYRRYHHDKLTFSLMYAFSENYILPFSHDEVVHGKHSMLDKQPGDIWQKFAGLRALYGYQIAHPGKKLLFMGGEFGQFIEWKDDDQLDWFLLEYEKHPEMKECVKALNELYQSTPALYELDGGWDGFEWLNADDSERSVVAFMRKDKRGRAVICVTNFTPTAYENYRLPLPKNGVMTEILNTDDARFSGSDVKNILPIRAQKRPLMNRAYSAEFRLPPLATVFYAFRAVGGREKKE